MDYINILMVGNSPSVKGGITSVITQLLSYNWEKEGIKMSFIPTYNGGSTIHKVSYFIKAYLKIKKQIQAGNVDVLHIHMSYKGSFARKYAIHKLCMKNGIPDVIHLHGSEFKKWYDGAGRKTKEMVKEMLRECASFIVLGKEWEKVIKGIETRTKILVFNNAVRIPDKVCAWNGSPFQVLYLGVLIKRKGVSDLLKAIKRMVDERKNLNIRYVIAGSGKEETSLHDEANRLMIKDLVTFTGWISGDKKDDLLKESQLFVLPSYNEGLPVSVLEAISYGMPVVATDVGDISSAVEDGRNGYLVRSGDIEKLSESILKIYDDKDLYNEMSRQSRIIAVKEFSENILIENMMFCYKKIGGGVQCRFRLLAFPSYASKYKHFAA